MRVAFTLLLSVVVAAAAVAAAREVPLPQHFQYLEDHLGLLFRQMDANGDAKVSHDEVRGAREAVEQIMPAADFLSFLEVADANGDRHLSRKELVAGIAAGLQEERPSFLETHSRAAAGGIDKTQDMCIACQYITERLWGAVIEAKVMPSTEQYQDRATFPLAAFGTTHEEMQKLREAAAKSSDASFLQTGEKGFPIIEPAQPMMRLNAAVLPRPADVTNAINAAERQVYAAVYDVVDKTLDTVCEQSMPNNYYEICRKYYKSEGPVVSWITRQMNSRDICYRIEMCNKDSYIANQMHVPAPVDHGSSEEPSAGSA